MKAKRTLLFLFYWFLFVPLSSRLSLISLSLSEKRNQREDVAASVPATTPSPYRQASHTRLFFCSGVKNSFTRSFLLRKKCKPTTSAICLAHPFTFSAGDEINETKRIIGLDGFSSLDDLPSSDQAPPSLPSHLETNLLFPFPVESTTGVSHYCFPFVFFFFFLDILTTKTPPLCWY